MSIMSMDKILIIDDDLTFLQLTSRYLRKQGMHPVIFEDWNNARNYLQEEEIDFVLVDLHFPGISGIEIIQEIKKYNREIPILMITAHSSIQSAIEAVKAGADDYIQKPCENSEIFFKIQRIIENIEKEAELNDLKEIVEGQYSFSNLLTKDEDTKKTYQLAKNAADMNVLIFIAGETGVGKEVLAKTIHNSSIRASKPFVIFNCATVNENLIESELFGHIKGAFTSAYAEKKGLCEIVADGTLFIDEVAELSLSMQKKLLRLLQEKEFEPIGSTDIKNFRARLIVASNKDLARMTKHGDFREDLFFRLNVFPLYLKPLRDRSADLLTLANIFLNHYVKKYEKNITGFTPKTIKLMMQYAWFGNIRELVHFIEREVLVCKKTEIHIANSDAFKGLMEQKFTEGNAKDVGVFSSFIKKKEREYFQNLLMESKGSIEKASLIAGIHRKTLYIKLKEHGLDKRGFKNKL